MMLLKDLVKLLPEDVCIYDWYHDFPRCLVIGRDKVKLETQWGTEEVPSEDIDHALRKWGFEDRYSEIFWRIIHTALSKKTVFYRIYNADVHIDKETVKRGLVEDGVNYANNLLASIAIRILEGKQTLLEFYP